MSLSQIIFYALVTASVVFLLSCMCAAIVGCVASAFDEWEDESWTR